MKSDSHSFLIEDANGKDHLYHTETNSSPEEARGAAERAFAKDAEHGFVPGPGKIVGSSYRSGESF